VIVSERERESKAVLVAIVVLRFTCATFEVEVNGNGSCCLALNDTLGSREGLPIMATNKLRKRLEEADDQTLSRMTENFCMVRGNLLPPTANIS
jgi:hypothetical protein